MVELFRKQLDELLGPNRNGDKPQNMVEHFHDERVCKYDLLGLCPYGLFPNTKQNLGKCPFAICPVPDKYKKEFEKAENKEKFGYDRDLEKFLEKLVKECDERIGRGKRRLDQQQKSNLTEETRRELDELTKRIEDLVNEGLIDEAQTLMASLENMKKETPDGKITTGKEQQLIVCEVCAALLSVNESDQRLADHFAGKMHVGFQKVRNKLKELRDARRQEHERESRRIRSRDYYKADGPPKHPSSSYSRNESPVHHQQYQHHDRHHHGHHHGRHQSPSNYHQGAPPPPLYHDSALPPPPPSQDKSGDMPPTAPSSHHHHHHSSSSSHNHHHHRHHRHRSDSRESKRRRKRSHSPSYKPYHKSSRHRRRRERSTSASSDSSATGAAAQNGSSSSSKRRERSKS